MKTLYLFTIALSFSLFASGSDTSFKQLMEGNERYANSESINFGKLKEKRKRLLYSQSPFAIILGCSDSRVPPEIIFDQSIGNLFIVRVAGNVAGPDEMDSIEYAADVLKSPLIMVLGHEKCGAVNAVITGDAYKMDLSNIAPLIEESVEKTEDEPGDHLTNAIKENVRINMDRLESNPVLKKLISKKNLKVVGGFYDLDTGKVEVIK